MSAARRALVSLGVVLACALPAAAQSVPADANVQEAIAIVDRRIHVSDYRASLSVGTPANARSVAVRVGVDLWAQGIDLHLHDVRGSLSLRASVARIVQVIQAHSAIPTTQR